MEKLLFRTKFSLGGKKTLLYGYRPAELGCVLIDELPDQTFRVTKTHSNFSDEERSPVRISLGCHVVGACLPVPDLGHGPSQIAGLVKRVATRMPPINRVVFRRFVRFVKTHLRRRCAHLIIDPLADFDFNKWIEKAPYPRYRKDELIRVYENGLDKPMKTDVDGFVKDEEYPEPKHVRGIHSRADDYKVRVGPFFQEFGDRLFASKYFIKKIPVPDRPKVIVDRLAQFAKIYCTDFSSYEATFVKQLMSVEMLVYRHALSGHPQQKKILDILAKIHGTNLINYSKFQCRVDCKRMSGEMNTSCGNGVMNYLITTFCLLESGNSLEEIDYLFEGDDGVIGCKYIPDADLYESLGCKIKISVPSCLSEASFCGNVFDVDVQHIVTNPMEASLRFGWTTRTYMNASDKVHRELLRSKSLSLLYEYPGCPILRSLALYGLRVTEDVKLNQDKILARTKNTYDREILSDAFANGYFDPRIDVVVDPRTRLLVEKMYGIPVALQLHVESYLDNLNIIQPLEMDLPFQTIWHDVYSKYTVQVDCFSKDIHFAMKGFSTKYYFSAAQGPIIHNH